MKILFLHGWYSIKGGVKPFYRRASGNEVIKIALDDFDEAVRTAQAEHDRHRLAVTVGSFRGGSETPDHDSASELRINVKAWRSWPNAYPSRRTEQRRRCLGRAVAPIAETRGLVGASASLGKIRGNRFTNRTPPQPTPRLRG